MTIATLMSHLQTCKDHATSIVAHLIAPGPNDKPPLSIEDVPQQLKFLHKQLTDMHNFIPKESVNADEVWIICIYCSRAVHLVNAVEMLLSTDKLCEHTVIDKLKEANSLTDCSYYGWHPPKSGELDITKL